MLKREDKISRYGLLFEYRNRRDHFGSHWKECFNGAEMNHFICQKRMEFKWGWNSVVLLFFGLASTTLRELSHQGEELRSLCVWMCNFVLAVFVKYILITPIRSRNILIITLRNIFYKIDFFWIKWGKYKNSYIRKTIGICLN